MHENDSNEETTTATPASWEDYFQMHMAARQEHRAAHSAFRQAGERLDRATNRVERLEAWAENEHKTNPYTAALGLSGASS